jgi:hypothetical protein
MTVYVSDRLKFQVREALATIGQPATTADVAAIVGRSHNSVRVALRDAGSVVQLDGSYPVLWTIDGADGSSVSRRVASKHTDVDYTVSAKQTDDVVAVWNKQHEAVGQALSALVINRDLPIKKVAEQIGTLAGSLAALAYELQQVSDRPDWYDVLTETD